MPKRNYFLTYIGGGRHRINVRANLHALRQLRSFIPGGEKEESYGPENHWSWPADYGTFARIVQLLGSKRTEIYPELSALFGDGYKGERLCVICRSFYFDGGSPGYSELTPGSDASMSCSAGMWDKKAGCGYFDLTHIGSAKEYRELIRQAATCPLFSPAKD